VSHNSFQVFIFFTLIKLSKSVGVRLGEHDLSRNPDCDADNETCNYAFDYEIEKIIVHKNFNIMPAINDIALIRLKEKIKFTSANEHIRPVYLPFGNDSLQQYIDVSFAPRVNENINTAKYTVMGFGQIAANGSTSDTLMKAVVPSMSMEKCAAYYRGVKMHPGYLCAGAGETDAARGKF
jgi:hypothetical protein